MELVTIKTREEWLHRATDQLQSLFPEAIPQVRIGVGFPSSRAFSKTRRRVGECWRSEASEDKSHEIFISPLVHDNIEVLGILAHELIHAIDNCKSGHRGAFKRMATEIGLEGKMTATVVGDALRVRLERIIANLGPYPHAKMDPIIRRKQSTRLLKLECPSCGYVIRTTLKWIQYGVPTCCCGEDFISPDGHIPE